MITTDVDAYQQMCQRIRDKATNPHVVGMLGYAPEVRYDTINYTGTPDNKVYWMRFTLIAAGEKRRTLATPSRVTYHGLADLQLFIPVADKKAAFNGANLAAWMKTAYITSTPDVDFYTAAIRDMPKEDVWFYKRISATYNYDVSE